MANAPWSGRLGRINRRCVYCGDSGPRFQISSRAATCLAPECVHRRQAGAKPRPEIMDEWQAEYERLARAWCAENGYDFEAETEKWRQAQAEENIRRKQPAAPAPGAEGGR